jgi:FtsX-like permease family
MSLLLGLRLAVAGGRESLVRLALTAVGVAVGGTLLLLALTAQSAAKGRAVRMAWQDSATAVATAEIADPPADSTNPALFLAVSDYYDGTPMTRAYVAALGADPPVPPGLDRLPGPGEVAASPAMRRLLASTPDDQLDDRFPGRVTMTIGAAGLAHDNELVAIIGRTPAELRDVRSVQEVRGFYRAIPPDYVLVSIQQGFLLVGAVLVLVPVIILIVTVTRVAAAQRERRLAAIRLVGATHLQTALLAAVETGLGAVAGSVLAWPAYEVGRRLLAATVIFQRGHFYLEDVAVAPPILALVLVGVPALVVLVAIASLRRVQTSPLRISRRGRRPPSAWLALPVVVGIGGQIILIQLRDRISSESDNGLGALLALLTIAGLVLVGPWLCMAVGQGIARLTRTASGLIAARRISADPYATFRAVSGVVLAASAVTYFGSTVSQVQPSDEPRAVRLRPGVVHVFTGGVPADLVAPLLSAETVTTRLGTLGQVVSCAELSRVRYVSCPYAPVEESGVVEPGPSVESLMVFAVDVPTDGTLAAENRVRTRFANAVPNAIINSDRDPVDYHLETLFVDFGRMGSIAGLFALIVGACSLAAGMIGGMVERRRPFALLRASGVRLAELRRIVFLETGATMVVTSILGMALGLVLAYVSTRQGGTAWRWPGLDVYAIVFSGVLAALAFSTFALPLLSITTRHDEVRYE